MDEHEAEVDWFTRDLELHPLSSAPEPKRRFQPSKWEEKKCAPVPLGTFCCFDGARCAEMRLCSVRAASRLARDDHIKL